MPEPASLSPQWRVRLPLAALLAVLLFWVGTYDVAVFAWLTRGWQHLLTALHLADWAQRVQQGTSHQVTTRSLPAMLTYGLLYTAVCLVIIGLLTASRQALRTALLVYAGVFAASAVLLLAGKLAGDVQWAYKLGRRLIDFIVSPLPVIALVPLLRWQKPKALPAPSLSPTPEDQRVAERIS